MQKEPSSIRPHIVLVGRRNVGKSSLVNALTNQSLSLVSDTPGTTTDPVRKAFELLPFGPVVFVDTGGLDDTGELGSMRVGRARRELATADLVLLIAEAGIWTNEEQALLDLLKESGKPHLLIVNKADRLRGDVSYPAGVGFVSALTGKNVDSLKKELSEQLTNIVRKPFTVLGDMIGKGGLVVLVVPIDYEAPQGRIILPQVMTLRDVLDHDAMSMTVKENDLAAALDMLKRTPDLVITDSQAIETVARIVPRSVPLTTFSVVFCRMKGDLSTFVDGAWAFDQLQNGNKVLISEACSHHPIRDDIATVKLPKWIRRYTGKSLHFETTQGGAFPDDLSEFGIIVHCAGCMITPQAMRVRMEQALRAGVPITNYGVAISYLHGLLDRVLEPLAVSGSRFISPPARTRMENSV